MGKSKLVTGTLTYFRISNIGSSSPLQNMQLTWHPDYPSRAVAVSADNSVRIVNPLTGLILTSVLPPLTPPVQSFEYLRTPGNGKLLIRTLTGSPILDPIFSLEH